MLLGENGGWLRVLCLLLLLPNGSFAATRYVSAGGSDTAPYTSWASAAHDIQSAVNASSSGDLILVTNGVYTSGGRAISGGLTNRVVLDRAVTVRSVNGRGSTIIAGESCPTNEYGGDGAVRCVYMSAAAVLDGFTLTNGHTLVIDDTSTDKTSGGGVYATGSGVSGVLSNCLVTGCAAFDDGGGVVGCRVVNCRITGNKARGMGGGVDAGYLYNCIVRLNHSYGGGGVSYSTLYNCTVVDNIGTNRGGGVAYCSCYNSIMYYNQSDYGNNYYYWRYTNCCTTPRPSGSGHVTEEPEFVDRAAGDLHLQNRSPCINAGFHEGWMTGAGDADGNSREVGLLVDIGAYEYQSLTDALSVAISAPFFLATEGTEMIFEADITGNEIGYTWDLGDGSQAFNTPVVSNTYAGIGTYELTLTASNLDQVVSVTALVQIVDADFAYYIAPSGDDAQAGTNWATAMATIQVAVDAAGPGCTLWVSNGVYQTGGRTAGGASLTNRAAIDRLLYVRSVNGPAVTCIKGAADPVSGSNGSAAVRCVYLAEGAVLDGFTLSNGYTKTSGDNYEEESAGAVYCVSTSSIMTNCVLEGNYANYYGGGVYRGTLYNSRLQNNRSERYGGGAHRSVLYNCLVAENSALDAGGLSSCVAYSCLVRHNVAGRNGGGVYSSLSCVYNCTVVGNTSGELGGGGYRCKGLNSIFYYNTSASYDNLYEGGFTNCCAWPVPTGSGNVTNEPLLVSLRDPRLLPESACINAGTNRTWMTSARDWYGEDRLVNSVVDLGCSEFQSVGVLTGTLSAALSMGMTQAYAGLSIPVEVLVEGAAQQYTVDMDDGTVFTNCCLFEHAYSSPGTYDVLLLVSNLTETVSATQRVTVLAQDCYYYVAPDGDDGAAGTDWSTAKATIQAAVDLADPGCWIWVSNGLYQAGGRAVDGGCTNRLVVGPSITVCSVNGPDVTVIAGQFSPGTGGNGDAAIRCVYLDDGAVISGFTLTNGYTRASSGSDGTGGGVRCKTSSSMVSNCVLTGCSAEYSGGGVQGGSLYDCILEYNRSGYGGGAAEAQLYCCMVSNNLAERGGGLYQCQAWTVYLGDNQATNSRGGAAYGGTLDNCQLVNNQARTGGGGASDATLQDCTLRGNEILDSSSDGGGAYNCSLEGCLLEANRAEAALSRGGGMALSDASGCTLISNVAVYGGGMYGGTGSNCVLSGNAAQYGGGSYDSQLVFCELAMNAASNGGGVFLGDAVLCLISNNTATGVSASGGGAEQADLDRCIIVQNTTDGQGGGASQCILYSSIIAQNSADYGGGTASCEGYNCTIVGNGAISFGGGAFWGTFRNSILYYNSAFASANCYMGSYTNCCASPLPPGTDNLSSSPSFVDRLNGDLHLQVGSPCINRGTNQVWMSGAQDLEGNSRILQSCVDLGALEYVAAGSDTDGDGLLDVYETGTGIYVSPEDTGTDPLLEDTDGDGMTDGQEVSAGCDPNNDASWLGWVDCSSTNNGEAVLLTWQSATGQTYRVLSCTNHQMGFNEVLATNIIAVPMLNTITDRVVSGNAWRFYQVETE